MANAPGTPVELKRQRLAWYSYGWATHAYDTTVIAVFIGRYLTAVAGNAAGEHDSLHLLGIPIAPGSLYSYTVSAGSLLLFALMPVVGAIADRTGRRRQMLLGFGYASAACCIAMIFVGLTAWQLGAGLLLLSYLTYSAAKVVYNSMLPNIATPDEADKVSSIGWATGYMGGALLLTLNLGSSFFIDDKAWLARISLCSAGVWWAGFAVYALLRLRNPTPGPDAATPLKGSVVMAGFRELGATLRGLRAYPLTLVFLVAYLIYYDGISTVITLTAVYADVELHLPEGILLGTILAVQFVAFGGALLLGRLAAVWGAKRTILGGLVVWIGVVIAAYVLPARQPLLFIAMAMVAAIVLGGTQALSRSLFSSMTPAGKEAEYFSLYEVSSSGTSFLGPLVFGLTLQLSGSYREAIVSLMIFFVVGIILLVRVNVSRAISEAGNTPPVSLGSQSS